MAFLTHLDLFWSHTYICLCSKDIRIHDQSEFGGKISQVVVILTDATVQVVITINKLKKRKSRF